MMKKHSLNHLGLWLLPELSRRDIQLREFAHLLGTTSQLSLIHISEPTRPY